MLKNIGLFCKRALQKRPVFCKETCIFKHPTHGSHPILKISTWDSGATIWHGRKKLLAGKSLWKTIFPVNMRDLIPQVTGSVWMSHVSHTNESGIMWERVMSHVRTVHVSHKNESCLTWEQLHHASHGKRLNESCLTYERVMSHVWMTSSRKSREASS